MHRHVWRDLPLDVPWGIALALTSTFTVIRAAGLLVGVPGVVGSAKATAGLMLTEVAP